MKPTSWQVTDRKGQLRRVQVAARTQAQLDRTRRNAHNPPPPVYSPRRRPS